MGSRAVREDLHGDVRLLAEALQVLELFAHDRGAADHAAQC